MMKHLTLVLLLASTLPIITAGEAGKSATTNVFAEAYLAMSLKELGTHMSNDVPTRRLFAAQAIATHNEKAWPLLKQSLTNTDWLVQSTALMALDAMFPKAKDRHVTTLKKFPGLQDALVNCLSSKKLWIRCQSAGVIGRVGTASQAVAAALIANCGSDDAWVRTSSIEATRQIPGLTEEMQMQAAIAVLNKPRTGFGDSRFAFDSIMKRNSKDINSPELKKTLVTFVSNHGQGMWNGNLAQGLKLLADLNPEPKLAYPLYRKILTDPNFEHANIRKELCTIIQVQGKTAKELLPALRKAIAREEYLIKGKFVKKDDLLKLLKETVEAIDK